MSSTGTTDPHGIRGYSWNWGDGTANSTSTSTTHVYAVAGTYTITLTVTDNWGRTSVATRDVTVA